MTFPPWWGGGLQAGGGGEYKGGVKYLPYFSTLCAIIIVFSTRGCLAFFKVQRFCAHLLIVMCWLGVQQTLWQTLWRQ